LPFFNPKLNLCEFSDVIFHTRETPPTMRILLTTAEQQALEYLARQKGLNSPQELIKAISDKVIRENPQLIISKPRGRPKK